MILGATANSFAFFKELGLELEGEAQVEGRSVDPLTRSTAFEPTRWAYVASSLPSKTSMMSLPGAHGAALVGELVQYENSYRLCYVRGPEGILVAPADRLMIA